MASSTIYKVAKITAISLGALILLAVAAIIGATFYLTPSRVAAIVNKEASSYLKADVKVSEVNWTLWSSFPWLQVDIDSISIRSRSLENIPAGLKSTLPANADRLASTGRLLGGVNIMKAIQGKIYLRGLEVDKPDINLVFVNDSVANFLIFPEMKKKNEMPEISLDTVKIGRPVNLAFFSTGNNLEAKAEIKNFMISGKQNKKNSWDAMLSALLSFHSPEYSIPNPIPVDFSGNFGISDDMKKISFDNVNISIEDLSLLISGMLSNEKIPTLYPLSATLNTPDLMALLPYIPAEMVPEKMKDVKGAIPLRLHADLLSPFSFSETKRIPALSATVSSDNGELSFPVSSSQIIALSGLGIDADAIIDPADPAGSHINLSDLRMETDGTSLHVTGRASSLLAGDPDVALDLQCAADLAKATEKILPGASFSLKGDLTGKSSLSCKLSDLSKKQLKDLKLEGDFQVAALALNDAASKLSAKLSDFSLSIAADMPQLNSSSLTDGKLNFTTYIGHGDVKAPAAGVNALLDHTTLKGDLGAKGSMSNPVAAGTFDLSSGNAKIQAADNDLSTNGLKANINASLRQIPFSPSNYFSTLPTSPGDSAVAAKFSHTPLYLTASISPMIQSILSLLDMKASVDIESGSLYTPAYPVENTFSNLKLFTNLDTLRLSSLRLSTRGASGFISGRIDGLRSFLSSSSPVPLKASLNADLDDVNINMLAGNYFRGIQKITGKTPQFIPPAPGAYTAADSLCVAIPRNIALDARLSSRSAEYMQYSFSPLSTRILMQNGNASLEGLSVGTPFCSDKIDWTFSTSDLDSISMAVNVDVNNFNFTKFCSAFPDLAASSPQLENLSANLSLNVAGTFIMDPNMFLEAPSLEGDLKLNVRDMAFKRDKKALKYTHLMMIRGDGPITIDSLDIHAAFHDNLLQLDPFTIDGGGYKLLIGGVNNLMGQMYYHIGLLHNPLHLPFGVNLVGYFRHPEFRFGGRWIKDGRERKIAAELGSDVHVNIMRNLSHGWLIFVGNAGKYDFKNNSL
ncbi:MAG: hypothetical protein K2H46_06620 [Muribaculaceae bacterium]|nr:hypothetical protein [Muribaculaceae bacterium]